MISLERLTNNLLHPSLHPLPPKSGRQCDSCSADFCNKRGDCLIQDGAKVTGAGGAVGKAMKI